MTCVKILENFQTQRSVEVTTHRASFFFDFPESITLPSCNQEVVHQLPPSIRVVKTCSLGDFQEQEEVFGYCDVAYWIEARVSRRGNSICVSRREITAISTGENPPPLDPEDLKNDYRLYAASSLGSFWKPRKSMTVAISSEEPRPMVFSSNGEKSGADTELLLDFKAWKMYESKMSLERPPVTDCEVMVTLEAITYFLAREKNRVLSIAESRICSDVILKRRKFKMQKRKLKLDDWKMVTNTIGCKSFTENPSVSTKS